MKHPIPSFLQTYRVRAIGEVADILRAHGRQTYTDIKALDMASAWGKFVTQYFGSLKPNPADYDMELLRPSHIESLLKGARS